MNKNTVRMVLTAIAAFYVVVGGLWATNYFPLQNFIAQEKAKESIRDEIGYAQAWESKAYQRAEENQERYALSHPSLDVTMGRLALYQSLLLWGTIALTVGGGVLFVTRRKNVGRGSARPTD